MQYLIATLLVLLAVAGTVLYRCVKMPGRSPESPLPELSAEAQELRSRLERHVRELAEGIGERHYGREGSLDEAARYIETRFAEIGYAVRAQSYGAAQRPPFRNLEVELPGRIRPEEIVLIGAHYDTVRGSPGADDNASGIAALLELARHLYSRKSPRTVRFVAFVNEEEPFASKPEMGSMVYAHAARRRAENIVAMISLESIGYYSATPGSQHYPPPLSWFYPDKGSFLAFVGNFSSRELVRRATASFRKARRFPSEGLAIPETLAPDIARSDHASFWRHGYPALMITDTVPFRNPHYHSDEDLPDTLDFDHVTRIVLGLTDVVEDLAH